MRTTLDIPADLMEEAKRLMGFKSKTDVVIFSLRELLRQKRVDALKAMAGTIDLHLNLDHSRRRGQKT